jgi:hypothetical protein
VSVPGPAGGRAHVLLKLCLGALEQGGGLERVPEGARLGRERLGEELGGCLLVSVFNEGEGEEGVRVRV